MNIIVRFTMPDTGNKKLSFLKKQSNTVIIRESINANPNTLFNEYLLTSLSFNS
jgi:hypothetical protein